MHKCISWLSMVINELKKKMDISYVLFLYFKDSYIYIHMCTILRVHKGMVEINWRNKKKKKKSYHFSDFSISYNFSQ